MRSELTELWRFRGLLWQLVRRELKVRYKNSRLGFLWSIAPPLMEVAVILFAFKYATKIAADFPNYSAFLLVAMIPWTYFNTALLDSSQSILMMYGVIKKVYLPREIIPLATAISNFIHFLLSWLVFFVYWWGVRRAPVLPTVLWFPYLTLVLFMLVTALSLLVSCLNVFYEDVKYIVTILMRLGFFLLPVFILVEQIADSRFARLYDGWLFRLYMANPLTQIITGYRHALLESPGPKVIGDQPWRAPDPLAMLGTGLACFLLLVGSYAYFNRRKWQFVERP